MLSEWLRANTLMPRQLQRGIKFRQADGRNSSGGRAKGGVVNKVATKETSTSIDEGSGGIVVGGDGNFNVTGRLLPISCMGAPPVVAGLRPK